jgi:hypothetical protein
MNAMKIHIFIFGIFIFMSLEVPAQIINDLVVFSNDGDRFTLILNGERRNLTPETNVKVYSLDLTTYKAKIIYENKNLDDVETNINFLDNGFECVFGLVKRSKRKHTLDYISSTRMKSFLNTNNSSNNSSTVNNTANNNNNTNTGTYGTNTSTNNSTYGTNTSTHTGTYGTNTNNSTYGTNTNYGSGGNISLNNGALGVGVNNNGGVTIRTKEGNFNLGPHNEESAVINVLGNAISLHKAAEKTGCASPMLQTQFEIAKKNIDSTGTDSLKMADANIIINSNCLLTSQVEEIMKFFKQDQTKLEFAIGAYHHTSDLYNYHKLKDSFTGDAYKKDFHTFVDNQK